MKKIISFLLVAVFSFAMFSACTPSEVTDENVSDLFKPSLEAYVYYLGSAFYDVEKDGNGNPITYEDFNVNSVNTYKIDGNIGVNDITDNLRSYVSEDLVWFDSSFIDETDNGTYVGIAAGGSTFFDVNSIRLERKENGKYYIAVDEFIEGIDDLDYFRTNIFMTSLRNGFLYIEEVSYETSVAPVNDADQRHYITQFGKFSSVDVNDNH